MFSITNNEINIAKHQFKNKDNNEIYTTNENISDEPDLIKAIGVDGVEGYVKKIDLYDEENQPNTPEEAIEYMRNKSKNRSKFIPVYEEDGKTIIGKYKLG